MKHTPSVLVVEDDFLIRACLAEFLQDHGMTVVEVENCGEAERHVLSDATIDVMVTDISLPDGNGKFLSRMAREHRPGLPVIFTSGLGPSSDGLTDELRPGDTVINKPYPLTAVLEAVMAVVPDSAGNAP